MKTVICELSQIINFTFQFYAFFEREYEMALEIPIPAKIRTIVGTRNFILSECLRNIAASMNIESVNGNILRSNILAKKS
jgi:hypothetical protein